MRLRKIALTAGALAIVAVSFCITLIILRQLNTTGISGRVQTASTNSRESGTTVTKIPFDSFYIVPGCSFSGDAGERLLTTLPQQYSYAVTAPLPFSRSTVAPGRIRARLQVLEGRLGVLVVQNSGVGSAIAEKPVDVSAGTVQVDLAIPDVTKAGQVVLRNESPNGMRARTRIFSIEAVLI